MGKSSRKDEHVMQNSLVCGTPRFNYFVAGFISLLTFLMYLSCLHNEFVAWDDNEYVYENPHLHPVNSGFFKWAFSDFYDSNWHPLTWVSHALDYAVWGLNPLGHHLTNNILHAVNTLIVVILVAKLLEAWRPSLQQNPPLQSSRGGSYIVIAAVTGLFFGLHPLHVESVAWVSERKDLLCAMFFLLSTMAYTKYVSNGGGLRNKHYILVLFLFALALLSKPMAVSLPIVLLILDWYPFNRISSIKSFLSAFLEKLPLIVLSLVSSALTVLAQKAGGAIRTFEVIPLSTRLLVAAESLLSYLWKMILPVNLIPYYPYPKNISLFSAEYLLSVVLVSGITAACIVMVKKQKLWLAVWGYYVITLLPVIGIVQVGDQAMADRYTYLPSISPFLIAGLGAAWCFQKAEALKANIKMLGIFFAVFLFISMSYFTIKQISIWKDSIVLLSYVIEKGPGNLSFVFMNRGLTFIGMGRPDKALEDYDKAISIDPSDFKLFSNRGELFMQLGQLDKAALDLDKAMSLNPGHPRAFMNYLNLGIGYGRSGNQGKAMEFFNKAIAIEPNKPTAYINRGITYANVGQYDRALEDFNKAILLDRNSGEAYANRGNLYLIMGKKEPAASDFQKVNDLQVTTTK